MVKGWSREISELISDFMGLPILIKLPLSEYSRDFEYLEIVVFSQKQKQYTLVVFFAFFKLRYVALR